MKNADLDTRPQDIAYFGFQCMLYAAETVDKLIDQHPLLLHYSLKLPQEIYNPGTNTVDDIFSPTETRDREVITQGVSRLFETPGRRLAFDRLADRDGNVEGDDDEEETDDQQGNTRVREPNDVITSPKMSRFLSSGQQGGIDNRIGYYGPLTFLDSQTAFIKTFGDRLFMLPINPTSTGKNEVQMMLREYAEK